jgi:nucleotide sugar dehydrogenase
MTERLNVAVVGLGKIGLPLAVQFASKGANVTGCDVDEGAVGAINAGECPVAGEEGLEERLAEVRAGGLLRATTDTGAAVYESQVIVCIVPVGIDAANRPDFKHLDAAAAAIGGGLRRGSLVILETTVPVGVTRNRFGRDLQRGSGLTTADLDVAYSPERVSSGRIFRDLKTYPKVVGGVTAESGERAAAFYRQMLDAEVMLLPDAETAEFAKLAESIYRDVNIALANELARAADSLGVDYPTAARASNSQPYSHLHTPGVGVGGHCIPVYPYFLLDGEPKLPLTRAGREVNDGMAAYAADRLERAFKDLDGGGLDSRTVLILGLAYRCNVKESAHSSSPEEIAALGLEPARLPPSLPVDAAILQAGHDAYENLDMGPLGRCRVLLDGRGTLDRNRVEAAGIRYVAIGAMNADS